MADYGKVLLVPNSSYLFSAGTHWKIFVQKKILKKNSDTFQEGSWITKFVHDMLPLLSMWITSLWGNPMRLLMSMSIT